MASFPEGGDVSREDLKGLGEALRAMREGQGLSLEDVERDTKIRKAFIEAIEAGDYGAIPGMAYARGFVKSYCEYLKAPDLWPRFQGLLRGEEPSLGTYAPPRTAFRRTSHWWLYAILIGAVGFASYLIFQQWQDFKLRMKDSVITKPAEVTPPSEETVRSPYSEDIVPLSRDEAGAVEASGDKGVVSADGSGPVSGEIASDDLSWMTGAAPAPRPADVVPSAGFTVTARKPCWIKVTDLGDKGRVVFQGVLKEGESKSFSSQGVLRLRVGNAGAASLKTPSGEMDPLGPLGIPKTYYVLPDGTVSKDRLKAPR
ncbi:hypothetical protein TheveDRAFT_0161 [Thermanaerovibrio velox DSM 12556]|uniref:Cytoskeleton protein RodZ-like C-terminal domain-containing protein n=1 Tax=Thermanaerovibrio velox DSM 12556 TaxID=926567 RepID=H0UNE1_9BACT|nr:RodZ domain-containing protein [Thermanaerovibrio velox]EHM09348.1 hypothetical protein TheveDRAFT_0161 [Thermanaerovibrio velox DSM 12556]